MEIGNEEVKINLNFKKIGLFIFAVIAFFELYSVFVSPNIKVYKSGLVGQAELARAEYSKQIATCEAMAKKESAKQLAEAEIIRAKGVAEANQIIGESLKNNESYLRYLWIQGLQGENSSVIYVPTEANLPILESTRLKNKG